jgi:ribosomal protein S18 acetylase RimI-like enzyme/catechol 2,3-dioxygenase-like lactoylglutathione lyase family enzyme
MAASLGLRHVNLNVTDLGRSVRFYTEAFGFTVFTEFPETITMDGREVELRQAMLTTPGAGDLLALTQAATLPVGPGGVNHLGIVYASNADVEAAIARAVRAGGEVTRQGEREDCGVREVFAYVHDPDRYTVELSTQEPLLRLAGMAARVDVRAATPVEYAAAGDLIARVFVGAGWSPAEATDTLRDVESRLGGAELLVAVDAQCPVVVGTVYLVTAASPHHDVAGSGEAEVGLLAVEPAVRGRRIGEALLVELLRRARARGLVRAVLSTQPTMPSAHRLYERLGFRRAPERDWARRGVSRLVFTLDL